MNGLLVIDKPAGWTSHDVVSRVRRLAQERSVGHLGTLDPMATGVLPLVLGKWTRLSQFYLHAEKTYEGVIRFGFATDTYDAEGEAVGPVVEGPIPQERLESAVAGFRGQIQQVPPPFSAKKIKGVPAYKLARKKIDVELPAVEVTVSRLEVTEVEGDRCRFTAQVSSGTYIRSIAHELGQKLGMGAHLSSLRRIQAGDFTLEQSATLESLEKASNFAELMIHPRQVLPSFPSLVANDEQMVKVRHGNAVNLPELSQARSIKIFTGSGELAAIADRVAGTLFQPKIVLCA